MTEREGLREGEREGERESFLIKDYKLKGIFNNVRAF